MMYEVRVCGIPAKADVTYYDGGSDGRYSGPPDRCYPAEAAEVSFNLYDRRGYRAKWLERKLDAAGDDEYDYVANQILSIMAKEAEDYYP
jgi:hypothetical protein